MEDVGVLKFSAKGKTHFVFVLKSEVDYEKMTKFQL